ncbi:MAG: rhombotarget lipoprotein [Acidobacteria bacterium]|nr:rhombotarget lipoprotein [Acidobacteriota bacterium]
MDLAKGYFARVALLIIIVSLVATATGCALWSSLTGSQRSHQASSVVQYLYPDKTEPVETPTIPTLSLPLKVGIAFVPEDQRTGRHARSAEPVFTEKQKIALMDEVSSHFKRYPFVKSIELIPTAYLTPRGSFANLEQLRTMFGVDVIALLSYDQAQFTDEGFLSLSYWTLVGAYVVRGEKNDTNTMMDAAVYDIPSHKMLFRAPGISRVKGSATPVNLGEQLRRDSETGFKEAAGNLVVTLQQQLEAFQEKVKTAPGEVKIVHKPGYTGGGSLDGFAVLLLAGMAGYLLWSAKTQKR